jgi:hypothetical protein
VSRDFFEFDVWLLLLLASPSWFRSSKVIATFAA